MVNVTTTFHTRWNWKSVRAIGWSSFTRQQILQPKLKKKTNFLQYKVEAINTEEFIHKVIKKAEG